MNELSYFFVKDVSCMIKVNLLIISSYLAYTDAKGKAKDRTGTGATFGTTGDCPTGWTCQGSGKNIGKCLKS